MTIILGYILNIILAIVFYRFSEKNEMPMRLTWAVIICFGIIPYGSLLVGIGLVFMICFIKILDWLSEK